MCCYSGCLVPGFHSCHLPFSWDQRSCGNPQPYTTRVTDEQENPNSQATPPQSHQGLSWSLMLGLIVLAIVIAIVIAWAFIHPLLQRHF